MVGSTSETLEQQGKASEILRSRPFHGHFIGFQLDFN